MTGATEDRGKLADRMVLDWLNVNGATQGASTTFDMHVHPTPLYWKEAQ